MSNASIMVSALMIFRDEDDDVGDHEEENESSESDSDSEASDVVKCYQWKRGEDGYLTKMRIETDIDEALNLWQSMIEILKEHIHTERRQFQEIRHLTDNLSAEQTPYPSRLQ